MVENGDEVKEKVFNSAYEVFLDYTQYSTIQGLIFIFVSHHQNILGRMFWTFAVTFMLSLGVDWSFQSYQSWNDNQVL